MGSVANFTLYQTDNDPITLLPDRQRLEMKGFEKSPTILKATVTTSYIYSWWFKQDPTLKAGPGNYLTIIYFKTLIKTLNGFIYLPNRFLPYFPSKGSRSKY